MIFGEAGSGKTFVVIDLIFALVLGQPFASFEAARPLKVAYTAGEGIGGLRSRFAAGLNKYHVGPDIAGLTIYTDIPQLFDSQAATSVYTFVNDWTDRQAGALDLLVIDTLHSAAIGADENLAKDAGAILQAVKFAREALNCTVLLIHHANKSGGYRGSSALHGAMDTMLLTKFDASNDDGLLECYKQKDAEFFRKRPFRLVSEAVSQSAFVEWGEYVSLTEERAETVRDAIIDLLASGPALNQSEIVKRLGAGRNRVRAALDELERAGKVVTELGAKQAKFYQLSF
jgi:hypothetical protein